MHNPHTERWDRSDLIRRVQNALDIAGRAVEASIRYELQTESGKPSREADTALGGTRPLVLKKVVAEAAMLLRCAASLRHIDNQIWSQVDKLAQTIIAQTRGERVLAALCLEPTLALDHSAAHIHLSDLGFRDPAVDRILLEIFQGEAIGAPERLPMQELEQQWLKAILLKEDCDLTGLVARTCVAQPVDILACRTQDLYTFTHVLLYASDMGQQSASWPRPPEEIAHDADAAVAAAIDANNFDLAAELIWTWPMLRLPWSNSAIFSFGILAAMQDKCGFLPGPEYSEEARERLPEELRDEYVLRTSYHATLVMGLTCAMTINSPHIPFFSVRPAADPKGASNQILSLLHENACEPQWKSAFRQLDMDRQEALAEFLLTIALRRARASRDIASLREGLAIGLQCNMVDALTPRHALALLRRVTLLGQILGKNLDLENLPHQMSSG